MEQETLILRLGTMFNYPLYQVSGGEKTKLATILTGETELTLVSAGDKGAISVTLESGENVRMKLIREEIVKDTGKSYDVTRIPVSHLTSQGYC